MLRASVCSLVVLALLGVVLANADESKSKSDKDKQKGTITKLDLKKGSISLRTKDADGKKKVDKTFQLADKVEYLDSKGKSVKNDSFEVGDRVLFTEKDGKITELKERDEYQGKITKVDAKKGTITVMMKDSKGKDVEKTFVLTEESEYVDSAGNVAQLDVFQSGDDVLLIEADGKIAELQKGKKSDDKTATSKKTSAQ